MSDKEFNREWKQLKRESLHSGWFNIFRYHFSHSLFAGGWSPPIDREVFERGNVAAVLPYDPVEDTVVLIEQFRIGAMHDADSPWLVEIVAGMIEEGEEPEGVAVREAHEEAGLTLGKLIPIREYYVSPGGSTEKAYVYCGLADLSDAGGLYGLDAEDEDIRVISCSADDAIAMLEDGRIRNALSIIALQWFAANRGALNGKSVILE